MIIKSLPKLCYSTFSYPVLVNEFLKQAVAELGHTRIPSCQLGQRSDQVEPDRVGMVLVIKRNFSKVYVKYL